MKKVSVIVPTYNQGEYLAACLDSLWFQEYENLEIIIVNDGSTDHTETVLQAYQQGLRRDKASYASYYNSETDLLERVVHRRYAHDGRTLRILRHEENRGLAVALNTGFRVANGTYCTYVPSDDLCLPHMIGELVRVMEAQEVDFVYGDMFIMDDDGRILRRFDLPDYSYERCFQDWYLCGLARLYRRCLHDRFGYYDEGLLAHDHELFMRFADRGAKFVHVPRVLMSVRDHGERQVEIHSPENWRRLIQESKMLVTKARGVSLKE